LLPSWVQENANIPTVMYELPDGQVAPAWRPNSA
jgi:hypothetical protein